MIPDATIKDDDLAACNTHEACKEVPTDCLPFAAAWVESYDQRLPTRSRARRPLMLE